MSGQALGVAMALLASGAWGTFDFLAKTLVDRLGVGGAMFRVQLYAVPLTAALLPLPGFGRPPTAAGGEVTRPDALPLAAGAAVLYVTAYLFLFRGMQVGRVAIVSPIAATYSGTTVVASLLWLGERISGPQALAIGVIVAAVAVIARGGDLQDAPRSAGVSIAYGLAAMAAFTGMYVLLDPLVARLGPVWPALGMRAAGVTAFGLWARLEGQSARRVPAIGTRRSLIAAAALDTAGIVAYNLAARYAGTSLAVPVAASFPAFTVLLARVYLRERLSAAQWAGVAATIAATVALTAL